MRRFLHSFALLLLLAAVASSAPGNNGGEPDRQDRVQNGRYDITIRGFYTGGGTATVTPTSVTLRAYLVGRDGSSGEFEVTMNVNGPYVSGTGDGPSGAMTISGRLDAPKASRLVCTYRGAVLPGEPLGYRAGRIAGILPTEVGDEGWDDEQRGH